MKLHHYPPTSKVDQADDYHGVRISDPFRWLEDERSTERAMWIAAQNAATAQCLADLPVRQELRARFEELLHYPRYYFLFRRGGYLFFKKNEGTRTQLVLCRQHGLYGDPEVLVDPTALSPDGTIRLTSIAVSRDGAYLAYGLSDGGSDWEEYLIKDLQTGQDLRDRIGSAKLSRAAWWHNGFYYSRYPVPLDSQRALSARNDHHQIWYHGVGTPQSADVLIHADPGHPLRLHFAETTDDERFVLLSVLDPVAGCAGNALWLLNPETSDSRFTPLVPSFDSTFLLVDSYDEGLLFVTNRLAPNGRVVHLDPTHPGERHWTDLIPERREPLADVTAAGGKLFVTYRVDAAHRLCVFDREGGLEQEISLPGTGVAQVCPGQHGDADVLWSFASFTAPPTTYRYDVATGSSSVFLQATLQFDPARYHTTRVFYPSKDGTRIPMFIVHKKGIELHGQHPSLLYGYGGYGTSVGPAFDPLLIALLERGVIFSVACLRGGGEYGEAWHEAGRLERKQTVFDDCIAAAEWLQANGYTSPDRTALMGMSNGGLLVGAVMVQRPDLFGVALPGAGLMDMLRFHRFTTGWVSTAEYGSSEDPAMFPILLAYSPLHNVKKGVCYPATLVTTYLQDDSVVPAHSFKFVAALQQQGAGPNPALVRIEMKSGHGAVSLPKELDERADIYAFLLTHLGGSAQAYPPTEDPGVNSDAPLTEP